jgi:hypothetical protein
MNKTAKTNSATEWYHVLLDNPHLTLWEGVHTSEEDARIWVRDYGVLGCIYRITKVISSVEVVRVLKEV